MPRKKNRKKKTAMPGIVQMSDGTFVVKARWTDPRSGKRKKREGTATTLAEAVAQQEEMKGRAPTPKPIRQRLGDFCERHMETHGPRLAQTTTERYAGELAHWVVQLGSFYVDALVPKDVRIARDLMARDAAAATVNGRLRTLRVVLDDAVADGLLKSNPARAVKALPEGRTQGKRGNSLSADEFGRFLETVDTMIEEAKAKAKNKIAEDIGRMLLVIAWTGMRRGELLALRWTDRIDGELHVERSLTRDHLKQKVEKETKTDDPRRIHIVEPLARVLDEQRKWLVATQHPGLSSGLMFPASPKQRAQAEVRFPDRQPTWFRSASCMDAPLERAVERAGITEVSPHSFRRTMENLARRAGVDGLVRRAQAGWRTETAQAIYATVDPSERKAAGEAVVSFVKRPKKAQEVLPPGTPSASEANAG